MRYLCSGFGANVTICGACAADLADLCEVGGGGGANVTICGDCAANLGEDGGGGSTPRGALVKHAFSSKVSVLPRREHRLFENRLGGVP